MYMYTSLPCSVFAVSTVIVGERETLYVQQKMHGLRLHVCIHVLFVLGKEASLDLCYMHTTTQNIYHFTAPHTLM